MQQYGIKKLITGKAKSFSTINQERRAINYSKNRIIREYHYFKTKERAEKYIELDQKDDSGSSYSRIWTDKSTSSFALIKYRKF